MINQIEDILRDIRVLEESYKKLRQIEASKLLLESLPKAYKKLSNEDKLIDAVLDMMDISLVVSDFLTESLSYLNIAEIESGFDEDIKGSIEKLNRVKKNFNSIHHKNRELLDNQKKIEEREKSIFLIENKIKQLQLLIEKHKNSDIEDLRKELKELEFQEKSKIEEMDRLTNILEIQNKHFSENIAYSKVLEVKKLKSISQDIEIKLEMFDNVLKEALERKEVYQKEIRKLNKKG